MAQSAFVSIEAIDGKVVNVEGNIQPDAGFWEGINRPPLILVGKSVNSVLIKCSEQGYELFSTEPIGKKMVYRFKLVSKKDNETGKPAFRIR